jgi:hypothetical protein
LGRMTAVDFERWLRQAQPGETTVYHVGRLAEDRRRPGLRGRKLTALANVAYHYSGQEYISKWSDYHPRGYSRGPEIVTLSQRRIDEGIWEYLAKRL